MKKEHITLRLDEALLRDLDALAGSQHKDRSELISELLSGAVHPAPPRGTGLLGAKGSVVLQLPILDATFNRLVDAGIRPITN